MHMLFRSQRPQWRDPVNLKPVPRWRNLQPHRAELHYKSVELTWVCYALSVRQHLVIVRADQLHLNSEDKSGAKKKVITYIKVWSRWWKNIIHVGGRNGSKKFPMFVWRWFALALACETVCFRNQRDMKYEICVPLLACRWTRATISPVGGTISATSGSTIYLSTITLIQRSPAVENHATWYSEWGRSCPQ